MTDATAPAPLPERGAAKAYPQTDEERWERACDLLEDWVVGVLDAKRGEA